MAAALTACDTGARVVLIDSQPRLGGSTALSGGILFAAGTSVQRAKGVEGDTAEAMFEYYAVVNRWRIDPPVARTLCDHARAGLEWLMSLGVEFPVELLHRTGMERIPRGHRARGDGAAVAAALERACRARDIAIVLNHRVERLLTAGGSVTGVATADEEITAASVIITTGGFGQNPDLLRSHYPQASAAGWTWSVAAAGSQGDALSFADQVGAAVDGHDHGLLVPTPGLAKASQHMPGWLVYVNSNGRRFMDESSYLSIASQRMIDQGGQCYALVDEAMRRSNGSQPAFGELFTGDEPQWTSRLQEQADEGLVVRARTISELAGGLGIDPPVLDATVERYNAGCGRGEDDQFMKDAAYLQELGEAPYYAVVVRPSVVALTGCGLRIDASARVLDARDRVIPGLYAAGEATGNVLGDIYIGSGNSIAAAIVFGRIAGAGAGAARPTVLSRSGR
jgi:fumarate reductase flavoprotein subunit